MGREGTVAGVAVPSTISSKSPRMSSLVSVMSRRSTVPPVGPWRHRTSHTAGASRGGTVLTAECSEAFTILAVEFGGKGSVPTRVA